MAARVHPSSSENEPASPVYPVAAGDAAVIQTPSESGLSDASSGRSRLKAVVMSLARSTAAGRKSSLSAGMPHVLLYQQQTERGWVIDPDARANRFVCLAVFVALCFNAFVVPFRLAFMPPAQEIDSLWAIGLCLDGVLLLDAVLECHRGYHEQGHTEMNLSSIRRRYVFTFGSFSHRTLLVDVLALVPIDLIELGLPGLRGALRANRLLLMPLIFTLLAGVGEMIRLGRHTILILRLVALFALLVHTIGCLWCVAARRV